VNKQQRKLRSISDLHMDDTAIEMMLLEDLGALIHRIREAAADGEFTLDEAEDCLQAAIHVYGHGERSYQYNREVEARLGEFSRELGRARARSRTAAGQLAFGDWPEAA